MYHVLEGIPFNMAFMMVTYIGEATEKNRFSLSYSMEFILLFRESKLDIPESESVKELRHTDYCNEATLHRMRYSKQKTSWVRIHPTKKSTFTIETDLLNSSQPATLIPAPSKTPTPVNNTPQPFNTNVQITSEHLQQITTFIINAFTP